VRTAIAVMGAVRFLKLAKDIDSERLEPGTGSRLDIALAALLALPGFALFLDMGHALLTRL